jgi:hypothetical protein
VQIWLGVTAKSLEVMKSISMVYLMKAEKRRSRKSIKKFTWNTSDVTFISNQLEFISLFHLW